jgi:hypothetical protein
MKPWASRPRGEGGAVVGGTMLVLGFKRGSAESGATVIFEAPGAYAGTITGAARADVALRYSERGCVGFGREMAADRRCGSQ